MHRAQLDLKTKEVYACVFAADGARALTGAHGNPVGLWNLTDGRLLRHAISCSRDIRLWDTQTGDCLRVFTGHEDTIRTVRWSQDQRRVLSAAHDRTVRLWDAETGRCLRVFEGHP